MDATTRALQTAVDHFITTMGRSDVDLSALKAFLIVAENHPRETPQGVLRDRLGLSEAAVSRNISILSVGSVSVPGPGLIESRTDEEYRRRKLIKLTAKGRQTAETLKTILEGVFGARSGTTK